MTESGSPSAPTTAPSDQGCCQPAGHCRCGQDQSQTHPLTPLSSLAADEITRVTTVLRDHNHLSETGRIVYMGLLEPDKAEVLAFQSGRGDRPRRHARALLLETATGAGEDVVVDLVDGVPVVATTLDGTAGHMPILIEEFDSIGPILTTSKPWGEALGRRGLGVNDVVYSPLSPGSYPIDGEEGRRIIRVVAFGFPDPDDHPWAHPVDGLSAYVDVTAREVTQIIDDEVIPVPAQPSKFHLPEGRPADLTTLKPIEISQPDGPSFRVDGDRITWANWSFSYGFDAREGLVLYNLAFADPDHDGEVRPIVYRASVAEMVVPYGDPSPVRFWQNYFDTGEYVFGKFTNTLTLGCDCLGEIRYFDAVLSDEFGAPRTIRNAICLHEEDYGTLWKHTDIFVEGSTEVRRQRRLVISFFTTVGNYDYGFYWYLYLDGKIELEAKLTGILFPSAYRPGEESPRATQVAPGLGAPFHQHLFSARLDMMVDGVANAVDEIDAVRLPVSAANPYGNAFTHKATRIISEADAARSANAAAGRTWHVVSTDRVNAMGTPTGYELRSEQHPTLMADPSSSIAARAAFTTKDLWVTAYDPQERYPSGEFVNQHPGGDGLPAFQAADRPLDGQDLVLWHTFGLTHFPRPEDWPVMPVDTTGFTLLPYGFFDRNPALNIPASVSAQCESHDHTPDQDDHHSETAHQH